MPTENRPFENPILTPEQALLAAVLLRAGLFDDLAAQIAPAALEDGRNRILWDTCLDLQVGGRGIDLTTVHEALLVSGTLAEAGGVDYLTSLVSAEAGGKLLLTPSTIAGYLAQFRERQLARAREAYLRTTQAAAAERDEPSVLKALADYDAKRAEIQQHIAPPQPSTFERMYAKARELPPGKHLPHNRWHKEVEFRPGQLALVAARPGAGKTSFLLQLCYSWLRMPADVLNQSRENELFLFFGYETPEPEIHAKLLALAAKMAQPQIKFPSGPLDQGSLLGAIIGKHDNAWTQNPYWDARRECESVLSDRFYAYHETDWTARQIVAETTRVQGYTKRPIGAVFVDYLQLVPGERRQDNRPDIPITETAMQLKKLAVALSCPVICAAQLNREAETDGYELRHLRDSGGLEQACDVAMAIIQRKDEKAARTLKVLKNRYGPVPPEGEVEFLGACGWFGE